MRRTRDTQLDAWESIQATLPAKLRQVYAAVKSRGGESTMFEVATALNWPINCVSGKITNLCDKGLLRDSGRRRVNPLSGRNVIVWAVVAEREYEHERTTGQMRLV